MANLSPCDRGGEVADLPGGIERVISRSDLISFGYRFSMEIIQTSVVSTGSRKISPGSFACNWVNVFDNTVVRGFILKSTTLICDFNYKRYWHRENILIILKIQMSVHEQT
jgi:hypothetical protein